MPRATVTYLNTYRIHNGVWTVDLTAMQYESLIELIEFYSANGGNSATIRGVIRSMTGCGIRQAQMVFNALEEIAESNLAAFGPQEEQQINA